MQTRHDGFGVRLRVESNRLATTTTITTTTTTKIKTKTTKYEKKNRKRSTVTKTKRITTKTTRPLMSSCNNKVNFNKIENHQESYDVIPSKWESDDLDFLLPLESSSFGAKDDKGAIEDLNNDDSQLLITTADKRNRAFSFECFSFSKNANEQSALIDVDGENQPDRIPSSSFGVSEQNLSNEGQPSESDRASYISDPGTDCSDVCDTGVILSNEEDASLTKLIRGNSIDIRMDSDEMEIMNALFSPSDCANTKDYEPPPLPVTIAPTMTVPVVSPSSSLKVQQSSIPTAPTSSANEVDDSSLDVLHTHFQMDLLNKGGRIGIYLPEARKKRIARFLAKRQKRIWHKKTRYNCRKKLAHNRVRVKGRFVKSPPGTEVQANTV